MYISGKTNYAADALSRITIQDLKELANSVSVLRMQTRSMTNKEKTEQTETKEDICVGKVYEDIASFMKHLPRIKTNIWECENKICAELKTYFKYNCIYEDVFKTNKSVNEHILISEYIRKLQSATELRKFEELQLATNDPMIQISAMENFKNVCNKELKEKKVALFTPQQIVTDEGERR